MKRSIVKHVYILFVLILTGFFVWGCGGGGGGSDGTANWDPDDQAPFVTDESPADGSIGVLLGTTITPLEVTATFNEAMEPTTLTTTTFTLKRGIIAVSGEVDYAGVTAVFTPDVPLLQDTLYTATITTGAEDLAGNPLEFDYAWEFTTLVVPDTIHPFVISTGADDDETGLPINRDLTATFNEPMDSTTLVSPATSFTLCSTATNGGNCVNPVAGDVSYIGNTATFNPDDDLTNLTWYRAEVTAAATDPAGNALVVGLRANPWWWQTGAAVVDADRPYVSLTAPADGDTDVPLNSTINATFNEEMLASTLVSPATNFTVCSTATLGGVCTGTIAGQVDYDPLTNIASFIPDAPLTASTFYRAEILDTGATDLAGNLLNNLDALSVPNYWIFTTGTGLAPGAVDLGTAGLYGTFGGSAGMTNSGIFTVINGNIGTIATGAVDITGFHDEPASTYSYGVVNLAYDTYTETPLNQGQVNGTIYTCAPSDAKPVDIVKCNIATQARLDANAAYIALAAMPSDGSLPGNLAGQTIYPGVWTNASSVLIDGVADLTLNGNGDANAVFVFQIGSTLTVGGASLGDSRSVILVNGAKAKNVFWQVGTSATINPAGGGVMEGNILANSGVVFSTAGNTTVATLNGRALSLVSSVTMVNTVINVPAP